MEAVVMLRFLKHIVTELVFAIGCDSWRSGNNVMLRLPKQIG